MQMQVTADVGELDQLWQLALARQLDLARAFAQLRRNPRQADRGIDVRFGSAGQAGGLIFHGVDAVLVDLESLAHGHRAQLDVVLLRAGEVLQRRADALGWHDAQIDLDVGDGDDRRPRITRAEHLLDQRQRRERRHDGLGLCRGDEDVDVAGGLFPAADAARRRDRLHRRALLKLADDFFRRGQRDRQRDALRTRVDALQLFAQCRGDFLAQAWQRGNLAAVQRRLQIGHGLNVEFLRELHCSLWADAGNLHQLERRFGHARAAFLDHRQLAGAEILSDLGPDALADAVDLFDPALLGHDLDWLVVVLDARRRVAVVGHAIAVFAEQLHRIGELAQDAGDFAIFHSPALASSRALEKIASNIGSVSLRVRVF